MELSEAPWARENLYAKQSCYCCCDTIIISNCVVNSVVNTKVENVHAIILPAIRTTITNIINFGDNSINVIITYRTRTLTHLFCAMHASTSDGSEKSLHFLCVEFWLVDLTSVLMILFVFVCNYEFQVQGNSFDWFNFVLIQFFRWIRSVFWTTHKKTTNSFTYKTNDIPFFIQANNAQT